MTPEVRLRWPLIDERIEAAGGPAIVTRRAGLHRTTLWRWRRQQKLPEDPIRFLRLAQALDVDPLLIFELPPERFPETCRWIGRLLLAGSVRRALGSLTFLEDVWKAAAGDWPPPEIRRPSGTISYRWHLCDEIMHRGQLETDRGSRNVYASIQLDSARLASRSGPQVWHFAYRDPFEWAAAWRPYGSVALVGNRLELYSYTGRVTIVEAPGPIAVETWFGEGDADFRIASLHPFHADARGETAPGRTAVCFELPRAAWAE